MSQPGAPPWRIDVHHHVLPPQFVSSTPMPSPCAASDRAASPSAPPRSGSTWSKATTS